MFGGCSRTRTCDPLIKSTPPIWGSWSYNAAFPDVFVVRTGRERTEGSCRNPQHSTHHASGRYKEDARYLTAPQPLQCREWARVASSSFLCAAVVFWSAALHLRPALRAHPVRRHARGGATGDEYPSVSPHIASYPSIGSGRFARAFHITQPKSPRTCIHGACPPWSDTRGVRASHGHS